MIGQELQFEGLGVVFESMDLHTLFVVDIYITLLSYREHCLVV